MNRVKSGAGSGGKTLGSRLSLLKTAVWKNRMVYTLILPGLLWYIVFTYLPMGGLSLAFKTYKANLGIWASPWVGLENFRFVFRDPAFMDSVWRTLFINIGRMVFEFPFPVLLAVMINEVRLGRSKKILQSVFTFPHFLSWIVLSGVLTNILAHDGLVNNLMAVFGMEKFSFLGSELFFQPLLYITASWKGAGWNAIIYMAAITGIDLEQYEAAEIDGASRLRKIFYITLPNIAPTIVVMFILASGRLMTQGFDQVFNLSNPAVQSVAETLDMYIYRITFQSAPDFGFSMAVSLFRSIINMILLIMADRGAKMMGGDGLFA